MAAFLLHNAYCIIQKQNHNNGSLKALIIKDDLSESLDLQLKLENIGITSIITSTIFRDSVQKVNDGHFDVAFVDIMLDKDDKGIDLDELLSSKGFLLLSPPILLIYHTFMM